jgi:DNA-binding FadR family transcriptional regulator
MTARTAALVLQARNVTLGDVHQARSMIEPAAVRVLATSPSKKAVDELRSLVEAQRAVIDDPEEFGKANARFHERLIELSGNQTIGIVAEMLNEIIACAVTAVSQAPTKRNSLPVRQRGIRSQERLIELIAIGASNDAEVHWRAHMDAVGKVMIGHMAKTVVDLLNHY